MVIFKCKMCGGALEINNETVAVCQYCGTKQTLPKLDDDRKANLYDRANHFRRNNEFDKAMGIYEQILNEDNADAESYWSLVLCRYGIEYVEDPSSRKRIPTINRSQYTSVFDDEDYKSAIKYADGSQKEIYESEANTINEIHKRILAISSQEEPFDVFICYKESDNNGRRTPDSVLATELYHELVREGFKVFFSRITLEDKLGQEYEPYIFAALNSAKVMVVLGTKPEYFNAVWVKNEWSRYLALIKNGARKMLIPAYKDMDPYDLPEEFSHLQAQDMSKLGFMQDLIRGIKKIVENNTEKQTIHETVIANEVSGNVIALLKRGYMALEDGEWSKADDFFEQCLNQNAELAKAYLGKLMAELQIKTQNGLKDCADPFDGSNNYQKAIRFADEKLKSTLIGYIEHINTRNEKTHLDGIYNIAKKAMDAANTENAYKEVAHLFETIGEHLDSATLAQTCYEKAEISRKDAIYNTACEVLNDTHTWVEKKTDINACEEAIAQFKSLNGWKDSEEKILLCKKKIEETKAKEEADRLERERQAEIARKEAERIAKRNKKIAIIITPIVCAVIAFIIVLNTVIIPNSKYNEAIALIDKGDYAKSFELFHEIIEYKDVRDYISRFTVCYDKVTEISDCYGTSTTEYTYDNKGNITKEVDIGTNGYTYTYKYTYDDRGNITKEIYTISDGYTYTAEYTYDAKGNMTKEIFTNSKGDASTTEYIYDDKGNMAKEIYAKSNGYTYTYEYTYDSKGNVAKKVFANSNGETNTTEYTYDNKGNMTKMAYKRFLGGSFTTEYTYDDRGKLTKEVTTYSVSDINTTEYTYDSKGNLTKAVKTETLGGTSTTEYTYEGEHIFYNP